MCQIKDFETILGYSESLAKAAIQGLVLVGLIKYDYENSIVYIINYHSYTPFGIDKPKVIASELLSDFNKIDKHNEIIMDYWRIYIKENKKKLLSLEKKLQKSRSISIMSIFDLQETDLHTLFVRD